ncbi:beta-ketoacyl-[acyl-carrier-protein] synthase family protein [Desulfotomaculum copahuensis]|uniref:Ketosynthase family 3 (KS3) domain-containing protein n=1 Tax=Desulfotomaculum copahuensis TaxID=1838280 RepID=A0A1B7LFX7_9FIRM|nr:beta-ketoacyl-[acyl-carrier-protein] synthase family protein [Desulfotomaculum copahuensis]OAT83619.1 hypothetical protein A6M21_08015 [Desulfotomaculum copahuensis]
MERVVVTGLGLVAPNGTGREEFWQALLEGRPGIGAVGFSTAGGRSFYGGEVKDFNPLNYMPAHRAAKMGRSSQLALAAARLALEDAGLSPSRIKRCNTGLVLGTTMGESQVGSHLVDSYCLHGDGFSRPGMMGRFIRRSTAFSIASHLATDLDLPGPVLTVPTACAAGNYAVAHAYDLIRDGECRVMLAGGVDSFSQVAFYGFKRIFALAPERCQPFDLHRKGLIVSEGAAVLVLESMESALMRGAPVVAEVLGYGMGCDAHHMTVPHPTGLGAVLAMKTAMKMAGLATGDVDYISAHGTGTRANDEVETRAIKSVFGPLAYQVPVSSIKSMIGHTMGAASAIEALTCCLAVSRDFIPPTINYEEPDPECDLDYVPNHPRWRPVRVAMSNAYAFGGNCSSLLVGKFYAGGKRQWAGR